MRLNTIMVVDAETTGLDVHDEKTHMVQVACLGLDPATFETIPGSEFCEYLRPPDFSQLSDRAMGVNQIPLDTLARAPEPEIVMQKFVQHVRAYNPKGKSQWTAPHAAGKNIRNFDLPLLNRYFKKTKGATDSKGVPNVFDSHIQFDLDDDVIRWLVLTGRVESYSMDNLRLYFGLPKPNRHDALDDVRDEARLLVSFLRIYVQAAPKIEFRGRLAPRVGG